MFMLGGSIEIVYVPVVGSVLVSTKPPLVPKETLLPTTAPDGSSSFAVADEYDTLEILRLTRCPAVAANVSWAFWPGAVVVTVTGAPPSVTDPPASGGTLYTCTVAEPVDRPLGSIRIVYVPVLGRVVTSMNPFPEPMKRLLTSAVPSGLRIDRSASENVFEIWMLIRWFAVPLNVTLAFWPGAVVESDTGLPPGVVLAVASGGTSKSCTVIEPPVELANGATLIV